jgi:excisionase family DNA binding protein
MESLKSYMRIKEAAEFLGVSQGTLRNWGRNGKISTHRHPINGYRLYRKTDLEALLRQVEGSGNAVHKSPSSVRNGKQTKHTAPRRRRRNNPAR